MTLRTVAGTGHRPATRNNPDGLTPAQLMWVRGKCRSGLLWLREQHGTVEVASGMALGFDLELAATAVELGFPLRAVLPFESQPDRWPAAERAEWRRLVDAAWTVELVGPNPKSGREAVILLHARNDRLLQADGLFACWDATKRSGGTYSAVVKAARAGLPVVHVDLAVPRVCGLGCRCVSDSKKPHVAFDVGLLF